MKINDYTLWTAIITPMNADATVDYSSFEKILRDQEKAQNGIVVLGSTGEALNLCREEAKRILDFTLSLKLNVPIMTGIGGFNQKETLQYITYLNSLPLDAYLAVTPLYAKPGEHGQTEWFKAILDHSNKPCMLYNVPGRTGVKMNFGAVLNLASHKNFWAIKEASGSVLDFKQYRMANPNARVYSGDDGMLPDFVPEGCAGLVSVAGNCWAFETNLYVKKALAQKLSTKEIELWKRACDSLFIAANPIPVKNLMHVQGKIKTNVLRSPLSHKDFSDNKEVINADTIIKKWFEENV